MLSRLTIAQRIWILTGLALLAFLIDSILVANQQNHSLLQHRRDALVLLVDNAYSMVEEAYQLSQRGVLTEQQAQQKALADISAMHYHEGNYFWVNDTTPKVLAHGGANNLVGQNVDAVVDSSGHHLYREFVTQATQHGQGFVEYAWPKPGETGESGKLAFVKLFPDWNWVIGTGAYTDDIEAEFRSSVIEQLTSLLCILIFFCIASWLIAKSIVQPLKNTIAAINDVAEGEGDLTKRLPEESRDELGQLAHGFNAFAEKIRGIVVDMQNNSNVLNQAAEQTSVIASQSEATLSENQQETHQLATAMQQMSATLAEMANNAAEASRSVSEVQHQAESGRNVVQTSVEQISAVATVVDQAVEMMGTLNSDAESISSILDVIRGIADQTNLLALNAAIEAARAGEHGRGFAVVADEVRTLAQRTQESTQEIEQMIRNLQECTHSASATILEGKQLVAASVEQATRAGESFTAITGDIDEVADMNTQIASATEEQTTVVLTINENIEHINDASNQSAEGARQLADAGGRLKALADDSGHLLKQFVV